MKYKIQILIMLTLVVLSAVSTIAVEDTPVLLVAEEGFSSNAVVIEAYSSCTYYFSYCVPMNGHGLADMFGYCC